MVLKPDPEPHLGGAARQDKTLGDKDGREEHAPFAPSASLLSLVPFLSLETQSPSSWERPH